MSTVQGEEAESLLRVSWTPSLGVGQEPGVSREESVPKLRPWAVFVYTDVDSGDSSVPHI